MKCCGCRSRSFPEPPPTALQSVTSPVKICSTCFLVSPLIGLACVHDHADAVVGDDRRFHVDPFAGSRADFRRFGAPAGHADLRGAVDDRGDAGGGAFRRDVKGGVGMLGFEGFRELRHELRSKCIGSFDDQPIGTRL